MNQTKKILALIFALAILLSFTACKKSAETPPTTEPPSDESVIVAQAQAHIEKGEYMKAYDLLYGIQNPGDGTKALLACFRFLETNRQGDDGSKKACTYDKNGNLLTETVTDSHGFTGTYTYTYDQSGNLQTKTYTDSANAEKLWNYTYDDKGRLLVEDYSDKADLWHQKLYSYNGKGQKEKLEYTDTYGAYNVTTYTYDEKGNLASQRYIESGDFNSITHYTYDDHGNLVKEDYSNSEDSVYYWAYSYDQTGRLLAKDYYDEEERWEENNWTYEKDRLVSFYHATSGNDWEQTAYTHDSWGNIATAQTKHSDGTTINFKITQVLYYNPAFAEK